MHKTEVYKGSFTNAQHCFTYVMFISHCPIHYKHCALMNLLQISCKADENVLQKASMIGPKRQQRSSEIPMLSAFDS